ncbi:MAG: TolC family protein [Saprospiraceae bacterium]|nr:TolC family protein [Saprospiraceae bacterium]
MKKDIYRMKGYIILFLQFFSLFGHAQILEWADFRQQILEYHPLARQANLQLDLAEFALLRAKGGFDPKVYSDMNTKNFSGKTYFQYTEAGVKLPTWAGLELKGAYNMASGIYLNEESTLPAGGQATLGFNWSLGQGLLMDERRAALKQAKIGLQSYEAERNLLLNDLMLEAAKAYWTWVSAGNQLNVFESTLTQARIRHQALRESFLQGDKPAIDTLETFIQVQNRLMDVNFAGIEFQNATLVLRNFIWTADQQPSAPGNALNYPALSTGSALKPEIMPEQEVMALQTQTNHPALRLYQAKLHSLDVERRLKAEKKKPVFDLNYNILGAGWAFFPSSNTAGTDVLVRDIKWGLNFAYPIINRKARGDWQFTKVKMDQVALEIRQKSQELGNKVRQYANEIENLRNQIALYRDITRNYEVLLEAEIEKFNQGESSVFLINTREQRWLDAQLKYLKLVAEYRKSEAGLLWATGKY